MKLSKERVFELSTPHSHKGRSKMSTQYDEIGTSYDEMRKLPVALLEAANVKEATKPYISGSRVLDLACGTGLFSRAFLDWGASSVLGVDISTTMVNAARVSSTSNKLSFKVADCSRPIQYEGGPFDLVFGAWLLNYAPSGKDMANMFRTEPTRRWSFRRHHRSSYE